MAPKKAKEKPGSLRRGPPRAYVRGLLGAPVYDSDEDEDYRPNVPSPQRRTGRAAAARSTPRKRRRSESEPEASDESSASSGSDSDDDEKEDAGMDEPLARRRQRARSGTVAAAAAQALAPVKRQRRAAASSKGGESDADDTAAGAAGAAGRGRGRAAAAAAAAGGGSGHGGRKRGGAAAGGSGRGGGSGGSGRGGAAGGSGGSAAACGAVPRAAVGAAGAAAWVRPVGPPRDWGGLTAPLLREVLLWACRQGALPTAGAVACVNRHWRVVCRDLEADALAAAPASTAAASALAARAAAAAAAALGAAAVGGPRQAVTSATADDSVGGVGGANGALPDGAGGAAVGEGGADESPAGGGGGEEGGGEGGMVGLWGCMNLRSRPGVKFSDAVMRRGLASGRWRQVRSLCLGGVEPAGLSPEGLLELLGAGCPGLTSLELSQCDGLVKSDLLRPALASGLPQLQHLDLSYCVLSGLDRILQAALAPRQLLPAAATATAATATAGGAGGAGGGGGAAAGPVAGAEDVIVVEDEEAEAAGAAAPAAAASGGAAAGGGRSGSAAAAAAGAAGAYALPCPLRVLRARECPRLGVGTLKALTPADPYVTLPPHLASETAATASHHQHPQGPPSRAALPPLRRVPLLLHLTELDLSGAGARSPALVQFPVAIERLQAAAPNLRLLRLDAVGSATYFRGLELGPAPATLGPGFPRLRVCELGLSRATSTQDQTPVQRRGSTLELLRRTVGGSPALRCLDVSGAMGLLDQTAIQVAVLDSASPSIAAFTRGVLQQDGGPDVAAAFGAARAAGAWVRRQGDGRADDDENGEDEEREALLAATAAADVLEAAEAALLRASGAATGTASGSGAAAAATATASRGGASAAGRGAVHGAPASTLNLRMPGDGDCRLRLCASLRPALRAALVGPLRELRASRSVLASDAGLHGLARLLGGTLQVLDVSESTHVTDAGLLHVAYGCTALRSLDVSATGITDWGVRRLMALAGPPPLQQQGQRAGGAAAGAAGAAVSGSWAGQQVVRRRRRQGVIDLVSDSGGDDEDEDVQAGCGGGALGGNAVSAGAGVGCRRLTYLDISKCRGVDRATRHAAAEGLQQLRQQLGLWATT